MCDEGDDVPDRRSNLAKMGREAIELAIGCASLRGVPATNAVNNCP